MNVGYTWKRVGLRKSSGKGWDVGSMKKYEFSMGIEQSGSRGSSENRGEGGCVETG